MQGGGCGGGEKTGGGATTGPTSPAGEQAKAAGQAPSGDVVRDWSEIGFAAALATDKYAVPHNDDHAFALAAIAQHDAVNSIEPRYETFAYSERNAGGDPVAAAAQAAHDVFVAAFPKQAATLDEKLASWLGKVADGQAKQIGITAGKAAAAAILAKRANDGLTKEMEFKPTKGFGGWQYTPPIDKFAYDPQVGQMEGFAMTKPDQFLPPPPPAFNSERYATDFNTVKTIGGKDSKTRTADQAAAGQYWYEYSFEGWTRIARVVSAAKNSDLWETAHLFGLLSIAMWDGWIAGFNAKYHYAPKAGIRPITAIALADQDNNPKTAPDPKWEPFMGTPPVPDYPSTHSVLSAAAAAVLAHVYGDATEFTMASPSTVPPGGTRSFKSFSQAATECANSRVWIGIHFPYATEAGLAQGKLAAENAIATKLKSKK